MPVVRAQTVARRGARARRGQGGQLVANLPAMQAGAGRSKVDPAIVQAVADGAVKLAKTWWTASSKTESSVNVNATAAPASVGVSVRGNTKLQGTIRVAHRELITSIAPAGSTRSYRINPVNARAFPYLSTLASMYDKYTVHQLRLVVVSSAPTTTGGRWYACWDPDSQDNPPTSSSEFMAMRNSMSMTSWQSGSMSIPGCSEKFLSYYPDTLKDHGTVYFTDSGAGSTIYDLYLEYSVSLSQPNVVSPTNVLAGFGTQLSSGAFGSAPNWGPDFITQSNPPTARTFQLPPGRFEVEFFARGVDLAAAGWTVNSLGTSGVSLSQNYLNNAAGTELHHTVIVDTGHDGASVTVGDTWTSLNNDKTTLTVSAISLASYNAMVAAMA